MNRKIISEKQSIFLISLFLFGDATIFAIGIMSKQDFWLSITIAMSVAIIMGCMYSKLHCIFPDKNLFDMIHICFGKYIGSIIIFLYTLYTFQNISFVFHYVSAFVHSVGLTETPEIISVICMAILLIWIVKLGINILGSFAQLCFPYVVGIIFLIILLLIPQMNINNISPFLSNGIKPILMSSFLVFVYPFGKIQVFAMIFSCPKGKNSIYKIYILSILISGFILIFITLTNILVLGVKSASSYYFPSYAAVSRINIGNILQRIEVTTSIVFILGSFFNGMLFTLATCKGVTQIFRFKDYRLFATPICLLATNLFYFQFNSNIDVYRHFFSIYPYYTIIFEFILPVIIFVVAIIKNKKFQYTS